MKGLTSGIQKEFKLIFRNGISFYMAAAPAILALVFIMVFGVMQGSNAIIAVNNSISNDMLYKLERIADIELYDNNDQVKLRVEGTDSISGVILEEGKAVIILEGNEGEEFTKSMQTLISNALSKDTPSYKTEEVEGNGGIAYKLSMICIFLLALFVGGATLGLSCVDERESNVIRAVSISPITIVHYVASKLIPALLLGIVGVILSAFIIGKIEIIIPLILLSIFGIFVSGLATFTVASFAGNQIAAIGVLKLLMPFMLVLPISSVFVSAKLQFLFYPFPVYWQYKSIDGILNGNFNLNYMFISFVVSIPWFLIIVNIFAKKTKIRIWR